MLSSISKPFVTAAASFRLLQLFFLASELFLEDTIGPDICKFYCIGTEFRCILFHSTQGLLLLLKVNSDKHKTYKHAHY